MNTTTGHTHLSQLAVERYLQGEIAGEARARVEAEISSCPACRSRLEATAADDRAFALRPLPGAIRALAEGQERKASRGWVQRWMIAVPAAAAAAVIAAVVWTNGPTEGRAPSGQGLVPGIGDRGDLGTVRPKGASAAPDEVALSLGFYVSRGGARSVGRPGERLVAGDRIQFWYDGPDAPAFALVGIDGGGAVTAYLPFAAQGDRALRGGRGRDLGAAIELDDAKGIERFFLCTGPAAEDLGAVQEAARSLVEARADLASVDRLPFECAQASVWIRKE
ncbi:MAG: hypothetical protein M0R80_16760 [Proteobacteria bacterium]|jgi:hypothetical protein|nr:hypothetical protein [Pseudomonadota bacterium]